MEKENELRVVTRQETFNDYAVREIAQTKAQCLCFLQNGRCKKESCSHCSTNLEFNRVTHAMSVYDNMRLKNYVTEYYSKLSYTPEAFMSHDVYCKYFGKLFLALFLLFMIIFIPAVLMLEPFDTMEFAPYARYTEAADITELSDTIGWLTKNTLEGMLEVGLYGKDITGDGKDNCQDRAILFKLYWDSLCQYNYNMNRPNFTEAEACIWLAAKDKCILVRNYNPDTGMNHLFPFIIDHVTNKVYPVEPDANWKGMQHIRQVFQREYDPDKNRYNETQRFMSRVPNYVHEMFWRLEQGPKN